jgi:hypothetical protein
MPAKKPHYHVQIRRNGAVYGTFGPYAKAPAKRRNTSKAQDGLKRRLATYDRKVAAISNDSDVLAAVRYLDKVESWAYQNGVNLDHATVSRLRKDAFSAGEAAGRGRRAARGQEIQRLRDEKRAAEKPYDWMRRNASTSHRGVRIQRTAGVTRFTHPLTGKRVSVAQRDGGLKGAKALIDAALDRKPVRRVANPRVRQNNPAVAAALQAATPYLIDVAAKMGRKRLQGFANLSRPERIKAIRRYYRFNLPVRSLLVSDAAAGAVADALVGLVESGGADAAISAATKAARSNPHNLPPALARK